MTVKFRASADGKPASLLLAGEVGWDFSVSDVSAALKSAGGDPVEVEISSFGGCAFTGLGIYEQLKTYPGEVHTKVLGIAASAASAIFMAGSTRKCPENSALMIHNAWSLAAGDGDSMRKTASVLDDVSAAYARVYSQATGRPEDEIAPLMSEESWLFGEAAVEALLATEMTAPIKASAVRMAVPADRFRAMPAALAQFVAEADAPLPESPHQSAIAEPAPVTPEPAPAAVEDPAPTPVAEPAPVIALGSLTAVTTAPAPMTVEANAARDAERDRQSTIRAMCKSAVQSGRVKSDEGDSLAEKFCSENISADAAREQLFTLVTGASSQQVASSLADHGAGNIGMSQKEIAQYSIVNLINYLTDKSAANAEKVGLELAAAKAAAQVPGQRPSDGGVLIPQDILRSPVRGGWGGKGIRAAGQEVGDFSRGGALVDTSYLAGSFIDEVYVRSAIMRTGMTMLTGLPGPVTIGKQLSGSTTFWVGENVDVNESELAFGLTGLNPKTLGVRVPFSRMALKYTNPDIEMLARRDMSIKMALGIDKAFLYGTGNESQPLGLANHTGLAGVTFAGGADLAYPSKVGGGTHDTGDWADYVALEGQIASEELDVASMVYLMNSTTRSGCKTTLRADAAGSDYIMTDGGQINGYGSIVSNQLQTNDVIFGNFADALGAMFGALDLVVDNLTQSAKGQVIITMFQDVDFGVRYLESFVKGS